MIKEILKVKLIETKDAERIKTLLGEPSCEICDNSVGNIFMWKDTLDTELIGEEKFCLAEHYEGNTYFALRQSDGDYIERIKALYEQFGAPLYLCSMTDSEVNALADAFGEKFSFEGEDGAADYIYDADALRTLRGKKYHSQRNHLNAFLKAFENYTFLPYRADEETEISDFFDRYENDVLDMTDSAKKESLACRRLLPMIPQLPLDARVLRVDGEIAGFAVMEKIGDTLMVHIEKGLSAYRGIYPMLVQLEANAYPDVKYINREEDDANEGLRRSKLSYNPMTIKQKYLGKIE